MVKNMKTFSVVRNTLLMKVIGVYIKFILFVKEEMTIFSVRTVGDSTANSEEPTLDTNMDFIKIETSSLDAEELRFNPSTGYFSPLKKSSYFSPFTVFEGYLDSEVYVWL